eukprot:TRINITY_DN19120_c0_g1_i1.p1 TRINITY_DN19120_c0_g1~~TRINITY_DN19120_c0_g1_i1.p1  ORF type:complete len:664 (+),score=129.83 TRINITY_DN19120_c0_g1_i1:51-1994(+)
MTEAGELLVTEEGRASAKALLSGIGLQAEQVDALVAAGWEAVDDLAEVTSDDLARAGVSPAMAQRVLALAPAAAAAPLRPLPAVVSFESCSTNRAWRALRSAVRSFSEACAEGYGDVPLIAGRMQTPPSGGAFDQQPVCTRQSQAAPSWQPRDSSACASHAVASEETQRPHRIAAQTAHRPVDWQPRGNGACVGAQQSQPCSAEHSWQTRESSACGPQHAAPATWQVTSEGYRDPLANAQWLQPWLSWHAPHATGHQLHSSLAANLRDMRVGEPTPCQQHMLPLLFAYCDRDLVVQGPTGVGKTLGYLIPAAHKLWSSGQSRQGPGVIVMAPTKELVQQIAGTARDILNGSDLVVWDTTVRAAAQPPRIDLVVATVGALYWMVDRELVDVGGVSDLIVDEVDKFVCGSRSDPFYLQFRKILESLPESRHTVACSATMSPAVLRLLGNDYDRNGAQGRAAIVRPGAWHMSGCGRFENRAPIRQIVLRADHNSDRRDRLSEILARHQGQRILVFLPRADVRELEAVARFAREQRVDRVQVSSGKHTLQERQELVGSLEKPFQGTDVIVGTFGTLARGLNLHIDVVVVYELPSSIDEYTHAIGRTGRAGQQGTAYCFYSAALGGGVRPDKLAQYLRNSGQEVPPFLRGAE